MTKAFILLAVTMLLLSFSANPLYASVQAATKNSARLNAIEIAGVISMMQATPSENMTYTIDLPKNCKIEVTDRFVKMEVGGATYIADFIQMPAAVSPTQIDCKYKAIDVEKTRQGIVVKTHGS